MMWIRFLFVGLALTIQPGAIERARVFERKGNASAPLFTFERVVSGTADQRVTDVRFLDPAGQVVASEQVRYRGSSVVRSELLQNQVEERYVLTVSGDEALFEIRRKNANSRVRSHWTSDTIMVDEIRPFVAAHWDRLLKGEKIAFRLVALNHARILEFTLHKEETITHRNSPAIRLRMQASSLFVRWFAPEIDLIFTSDGGTLLESRGPLPIKVRRDSALVDLDARLVWDP